MSKLMVMLTSSESLTSTGSHKQKTQKSFSPFGYVTVQSKK